MVSCLFPCARAILRFLGAEPVTLEQAYAKVKTQQDSWSIRNDQSERWKKEANEGIVRIADFAIPYIQGSNGVAVHLGCGVHELSQKLCEQGWKVHAVDSSEEVLDRCKKKFTNINSVEFHWTSIEKFVFPKQVNLIYTDALSYIEPKEFRAVLKKISVALKGGGFFIGTFSPSLELGEADPFRTERLGAWHISSDEAQVLLKKVGDLLFCEDNTDEGSRRIRFVVQKTTPPHHKEL